MIFPQERLSAPVQKRYRPLAGPFHPEADEALFEALMGYLRQTGARVLTVRESRGSVCDGVSIYRLRSECCESGERRAKR